MLTIHKANPDGHIVTSYPAWLLSEGVCVIALARWLRPSLSTPYITFAHGDFILEIFYADRPYNVFVLFDGAHIDQDAAELVSRWHRLPPDASLPDLIRNFCATWLIPCLLKGYYVNFTYPASYDPAAATLIWRDLALDLWVPPQGQPCLLDEDEYAALDLARLDPAIHQAVAQALSQLWADALARTGPFAPPPS